MFSTKNYKPSRARARRQPVRARRSQQNQTPLFRSFLARGADGSFFRFFLTSFVTEISRHIQQLLS
jgi:hypothetical protein